MARFSKSAKCMKLAANDVVRVHGVRGKVLAVDVVKSAVGVDVLVQVDFSRGTGYVPNVLHLSDIHEVRHDGAWVTMEGEVVEV